MVAECWQETVIVLWACGLFEPWASRSHNYEPFTRTSVNYVEPYLGRAPQLYDGNWTTMRQGRVFVVTFSLPILSCDFLAEKDKYVQAIADAHSVPASEVTLMEPRSCPNAAAGAVDSNQQIRMHVAVNDLEQAVQQLELDLSDKWKKDPLNKNPAGQVQKGQADYPDKGESGRRITCLSQTSVFTKFVQTFPPLLDSMSHACVIPYHFLVRSDRPHVPICSCRLLH